MRELSGLSSGVGIRSVGGGEGLRGLHRSDSGRGPPRVGWFPLTKTPLKSLLIQGGTVFSSNVAPQKPMKNPLAHGCALYVLVTIMWLVPDRRIEKTLVS